MVYTGLPRVWDLHLAAIVAAVASDAVVELISLLAHALREDSCTCPIAEVARQSALLHRE